MKKLPLLLILLTVSLPLHSQSASSAADLTPTDIEGTWILDTAIICQTSEDGSITDTSIYLLGDTLVTAQHPQPPQRVVITPKKVIFEYSSPIQCRSIIEHIRTGEYSFDGRTLKICFQFYEEYICSRCDKECLHLHYTCFLADDVQQFIEHGIFKFKSANTLKL